MGEESDAKSVKKTKIAKAFPKTGGVMTFLFDYGDDWLFSRQDGRRRASGGKSEIPQGDCKDGEGAAAISRFGQ